MIATAGLTRPWRSYVHRSTLSFRQRQDEQSGAATTRTAGQYHYCRGEAWSSLMLPTRPEKTMPPPSTRGAVSYGTARDDGIPVGPRTPPHKQSAAADRG